VPKSFSLSHSMNHYSKSVFVYDLLVTFSSKILNLVKILLSSITCLTRVQRKMSGMLTSTYLSSIHGIRVTYRESGGKSERALLVNGVAIKSGPDDALGTGALQWFREVAHEFRDEMGEIKKLPVVNHFNVKIEQSLARVSLRKVDSLLEKFKEMQIMQSWVKRYEACKALPINTSKLQKIKNYQMFNILAGLFGVIREKKIRVSSQFVSGKLKICRL